jgi:hypothetical protein
MFNRFCEKLGSASSGGGGPPPTADPPTGTANIIHNSRFQVRNKTGQASVNFAVGTAPTQHVRRWYGYCDDAGFRTEISSANTADCLVIKRYTGDEPSYWRLVQVYDTEDSLRLLDKSFTFCLIARLKNSSTNAAPLSVAIYTGTGTDQSAANLLGGSWTGQTLQGGMDATLTDTYQTFLFDVAIPAGVTQVAILLYSAFPLTNSADDEIWIQQLTACQSPGNPVLDSKSLALAKQECNRYYQEMDPYLTTTKITLPIHMRAVPTITAGVASTTTGTTADVLVINRNSGSGSVNVKLDCEL